MVKKIIYIIVILLCIPIALAWFPRSPPPGLVPGQFCGVTGCTMQGDINMSGYTIFNATFLNSTFVGETVANGSLDMNNENITNVNHICDGTFCYTIEELFNNNIFDQYLNTTSNVTFNNINITGEGIYWGSSNSDYNYSEENVRLGVFENTPRLLFEKNEGDKWVIDHGGEGLRFYKHTVPSTRVTMRVNVSGVRLGENEHRRDLDVFGNVITHNPEGNGGNLVVDGYGNFTGRLYSNISRMFAIANQIQTVDVGGVWYNLSMNQSTANIHGFTFKNDNVTVVFSKTGHYVVTYGVGIIDSAANPTADVAIRLVLNNEEILGSYVETDTTRQNSDIWLEHTTYFDANINDEIRLQYISSDTTVTIEQEETYSDNNINAFGYMREIISLP